MPNLGKVLKDEIQRLAARVSRKADAQLKKDVGASSIRSPSSTGSRPRCVATTRS
ncbi:MAG: hypothetical protein KGM24_09565 [Elusimicrobia bacterium]|nr:hypothetical protein [Elusimicrobiota bacterium]